MREWSMSDLEIDRLIDPGQLDVEAVKQADLFFDWAERSVHAKTEADLMEHDLDVLEAKLQIECRNNPEKFALNTTTEAAIKAAVKLHPKYDQAIRRYYQAREASALLDKAVAAMEQKKRMIEVLCTLHGQQYFAGPSVPRDLVGAWNAHRGKVEEEVTSRQVSTARKRVRKQD